jgi:hypothetical protein
MKFSSRELKCCAAGTAVAILLSVPPCYWKNQRPHFDRHAHTAVAMQSAEKEKNITKVNQSPVSKTV